jgi:hypothetical protein
MVSLLKAWFGDAATEENDYCFDYLPRLTGNHSIYPTMMGMIDGSCKGFFVMGQNPRLGSQEQSYPLARRSLLGSRRHTSTVSRSIL